MTVHRRPLTRTCAAALLAVSTVALTPLEPGRISKSYLGWVSNSRDGTVSVIDLDTYAVVATYDVGRKPLGIKAVGASRAVVAVQGQNQIVVVEAANGVVETHDVGRGPQDVAIPSTADLIYVSLSREDTIQAVTKEGSGTKVKVGRRPGSIAYSDDDKWFVSVSKGDGTVDIFRAGDLPSGRQPRMTVAVGTKPTAVGFHFGNKEVAVASPTDGIVTTVLLENGTVESTVAVPGGPWAVAYSPVHGVAVTRTRANAVRLFSFEVVVFDVAVGRKPRGLAYTPDGKRILVANSRSATVSVIEVATGTVVATVGVGRVPVAVAVSEGT